MKNASTLLEVAEAGWTFNGQLYAKNSVVVDTKKDPLLGLDIENSLLFGVDREGEHIGLRMYTQHLTVEQALQLCEKIQQLCAPES